ncbi:hypothetical protein [Bacillus spizizenii]|uniref:hypothetical protein n=1 Tax=Bacillus spizizenii TaxID=96241 RepID=UPI00086BD060|nr:hypothetical protein [Bacillus spizizenii]MED0869770.1 hypothetical protein [Bacillus spizizenii]MED1071546.1 hypothetical protein [Bacillus spizizenii]SCV39089.1 Anthranilate phosphoribosyltransferase (EC [Bacillus subtilis]
MFSGKASDVQIAAFLIAERIKTETSDEAAVDQIMSPAGQAEKIKAILSGSEEAGLDYERKKASHHECGTALLFIRTHHIN